MKIIKNIVVCLSIATMPFITSISAAKSQADSFGDSSLSGTYTMFLHGGTNETGEGASIGLVTYDGDGTILDGFLEANDPKSREHRLFFGSSISGNYKVNGDGTVSQDFVFTIDGNVANVPTQMVITDTRHSRAKALQGVLRIPSLTLGGLVSFNLYRLPSHVSFSTASLKGKYAVTIEGGVHESLGTGILEFDGYGSLVGYYTDVVSAATQSTIVHVGLSGNYDVDTNTIIRSSWVQDNNTPITGVDFVITNSSRGEVTELIGLMDTVAPLVEGDLVTVKLSRID